MSNNIEGVKFNNNVIINANVGKDNLVTFEQFSEMATTFLDKVEKIVLSVYGPNAMNTLICVPLTDRIHDNNVFTNDGINILSSFTPMSPIEGWLVKYLRYIAKRVEETACDGTSTAILLSIAILRYIIASRGSMVTDIGTGSMSAHMKECMDLKETIISSLDKVKAMLDKNKYVKGDDGFDELLMSLAVTTCKGDTDLAKMAIEAYSNTPKCIANVSYYEKSQLETDVRFSLSVNGPDWFCPVVLTHDDSIRNHFYGRGLKRDNCDVLCIPDMVPSVHPFNEIIKYYAEDNDKHLVVLFPHDQCSKQFVQNMSKYNPNNVTMFTYCSRNMSSTNPLMYRVLLASVGKRDVGIVTLEDFTESIIRDVDVVWDGNTVEISGLYTNTGGIHDLYGKDNEYFNKLEKELREGIEDFSKRTSLDVATLELQSEAYRCLVGHHLPIIRIGGNRTELLNGIDIVKDVSGVIGDAIINGLLIDTVPKILSVFIDSGIISTKNARTIISTIHGHCPLTLPDSLSLKSSYISESGVCVYNKSEFVPTQNFSALDTGISRIKETIPEIATMSNILVQGGVWK